MLFQVTPIVILLGLACAQPRPNPLHSNNSTLLKYPNEDPINRIRSVIADQPVATKRAPLKSSKPLVADVSRNRLVASTSTTTKPVPSPIKSTLNQNRQHLSRNGQLGNNTDNSRFVVGKLPKKIKDEISPSPTPSSKLSPISSKLRNKKINDITDGSSSRSDTIKLSPSSTFPLRAKNKLANDMSDLGSRHSSPDMTKLSLISSKLKNKRNNDPDRPAAHNSPLDKNSIASSSKKLPIMKFKKPSDFTNGKKEPRNTSTDIFAAKKVSNNISFPNLKRINAQDQNTKPSNTHNIRTTPGSMENERKRRMPPDLSALSNSMRAQKNSMLSSIRDSQPAARKSGLR